MYLKRNVSIYTKQYRWVPGKQDWTLKPQMEENRLSIRQQTGMGH